VRGRGVRETAFAAVRPMPHALRHPALVARANAPTPDAASLVEHAPDVLDQGGVGSCEGHGWACAIATRATASGDPLNFVPSPDTLYRLARCVERAAFPTGPAEPLGDDGTDSPAVIVAIEQYGVRAMNAPTPDGRYSDCTPEDCNAEPRLDELEQADRTRLVGAYAVTGSQADRVALCVALLAAGVPVVTEEFVDTAYERLGPGVIVDHCDTSDPKGGGHCQCLLAYKRAADGSFLFLQRNSWSRAWGSDGSVWITENMIGAATGLYAADVRRAA